MSGPVAVGDVLAEKYRVMRILGVGGMGVVVAAHHLELDKLVALKFMHDEAMRNAQNVDRFLREARAAARLTNEHVGRVLDVGRLPGGIPFIVMEYLEGRDLHGVLVDRGPLSIADACEYVLQACEAMAEAHAQGIIHRDIKPENLFLTTRPDGRPLLKVLDFGISKALHASGPTGTYTTLGTPTHMSPEQMRSSRTVDQRADIWSLGAVLYQLLTGRLPFEGDTITEIMLKVIHDPLPPLPPLRPGLPPALVAAVEKCLEKDRDRRFENVAELAHELVPFAPERARAALSVIERVVSTTSSTRQISVPDDADLPHAPPRRGPIEVRHMTTTLGNAAAQSLADAPAARPRWKWPVAAASLVVVLVVVGLAVRRGDSGGDPAESTIAPASSSSSETIAPSSSSEIAPASAPASPASGTAPASPSSQPTAAASQSPAAAASQSPAATASQSPAATASSPTSAGATIDTAKTGTSDAAKTSASGATSDAAKTGTSDAVKTSASGATKTSDAAKTRDAAKTSDAAKRDAATRNATSKVQGTKPAAAKTPVTPTDTTTPSVPADTWKPEPPRMDGGLSVPR